jgi:hypothetical protein
MYMGRLEVPGSEPIDVDEVCEQKEPSEHSTQGLEVRALIWWHSKQAIPVEPL